MSELYVYANRKLDHSDKISIDLILSVINNHTDESKSVLCTFKPFLLYLQCCPTVTAFPTDTMIAYLRSANFPSKATQTCQRRQSSLRSMRCLTHPDLDPKSSLSLVREQRNTTILNLFVICPDITQHLPHLRISEL